MQHLTPELFARIDEHVGPTADLTLRILSGKGLPKTDWWGHCDAYVIVIAGEGQETVTHKTTVAYKTANPVWENEELQFQNVYNGCPFTLQVFDRDHMRRDDFVASTGGELTMAALRTFGPAGEWITWEVPVKKKNGSVAGTLKLELLYRESIGPHGPMLCRGPARYRIALSPLTGRVLGNNGEAGWRVFAAYKIWLAGVRWFFPDGDAQPWNQDYDKAKQLFNSKIIMSTINAQHTVLYADTRNQKDQGLLRTGEDFVRLLDYGVRLGERRYYTYVLLGDDLRFSETGASFLADIMSKHAMHSNCAQKIVIAGEFCLLPSDKHPGATKLIIDNNSGTYAPPDHLLPALRDLMSFNFPGLIVETMGAKDPELKKLHALFPSRSRTPQQAVEALKKAGVEPVQLQTSGNASAPPAGFPDASARSGSHTSASPPACPSAPAFTTPPGLEPSPPSAHASALPPACPSAPGFTTLPSAGHHAAPPPSAVPPMHATSLAQTPTHASSFAPTPGHAHAPPPYHPSASFPYIPPAGYDAAPSPSFPPVPPAGIAAGPGGR